MSKDIRAFAHDLQKAADECTSEQAMHTVGTFIRDRAKLAAPGGTTGLLRNSIGYAVQKSGRNVTACVGTNLEYAMYVEFGTGPKGAARHKGVSPEVAVSYRRAPWWVHESQLDPQAIEKYHWFSIETKQGRFYQISGQAAQPFLYPAIKNNEPHIVKLVEESLRRAVEKRVK